MKESLIFTAKSMLLACFTVLLINFSLFAAADDGCHKHNGCGTNTSDLFNADPFQEPSYAPAWSEAKVGGITKVYGGQYLKFAVTKGNIYVWSTEGAEDVTNGNYAAACSDSNQCGTDGKLQCLGGYCLYPFDTELTLLKDASCNSAAELLAYSNTDGYRSQSALEWKATFDGIVTLLVTNNKYTQSSSGEGSYVNCQPTTSEYTTTVKWQRSASEHCETCDAAADYKVDKTTVSPATAPAWTTVQSKSWIDLTNFSADYNLSAKLADADANWIKPGSYIVFNVVEDQIYRWSTCVSEFYDTQLSLFKGAGTNGDCGQFLAYGDDSQVSYKYNNKDYCPAGTKQTVLEWQANFTGQVTLLFNEYNCYQCYKRTVAGNNWAHCFEVTETYKKGTNGEVEKDSEGFPVLADASTDASEKITMTYMYAFPLDWQRYDCTSALCTSGSPKAKISDFGDSGWEEFSATGGSQSLSAGDYMNFSLRRGSKYLFKSSKQNALITIKAGSSCTGKTLAQGVGQLAYFAETDPATAGADPNATPDVITVFVSDAECQSGSNTLTYSFYSTSGADVSKRYTSQASGEAKIYTDNTTNLIFLDTNDWSPTWKQAMQKCEEFAVSSDAEVTPCPPTQCPPNHTPISGNDKYCDYNGAGQCDAPVCGYNYTEYPKDESTDSNHWGKCYYSGDNCDVDTESIQCEAKSHLQCQNGTEDWYSVTISNVSALKPCCKCPSGYTRKKQKVGLKYQYICVQDCSATQCVTIGGGCSDMAVESGCPAGYVKDDESDMCYDSSTSHTVYTDPLVKYDAHIDTTPHNMEIQGSNGSSTACPLGTTLDSSGTMCQIDNCGTWTFRNATYSANSGGNFYVLTDKDKCYKTEADAINGSGDTVPCCCHSSITIRGFTNSANNVTLLYDSTHTVYYKSGISSLPLECSAPETVACAEGWTSVNNQCMKCSNAGDVLYQRGTSTNWACRGNCENYMTTTDNPPEQKCVSCNNSDEKPVVRIVEEGSVVKEVWECIKCPGDRDPILNNDQYTCLNTACNEDDFIKDGLCYPSAGDEGTQCKEGWVKDPQDEDRCRKVNTGQPYVECANSAAVFKDNSMSGSAYDGETFLTCNVNKPNSVDCDCFYGRCETGYTDADKRICPATYTYKGVTYNIDPVYDANGFVTACKFTDVDGNICGESIGGWTLPNINQLYSLIDFDLYDPATSVPFTGGFYIRPESTVESCAPDPTDQNDHFGDKACGSDGHYICMDGKCVRNNWYWSSTTVVSENASEGEFVWSVNMQDGRSYRAVKGCTTTAECESDSGLNARAHKVMCVKGSSFSGIFDADAPSSDQTFSGWACNKSNDQVPLAIYFEITDSSATRKNIVSLLGDSDFISDIPGISKKGIKYESYDGSTLTAATDIQPEFGTALYDEIYNNCGPNSVQAPHAFKVKWTEGSETTGKTNVSALIRSIKTKECSDEIINAVYNGGSPDTSECAVPPYFVTAYAVDPTEAALAAVAIAPTERPFVIVNRCGDNYQTNDGTYTENCEKESFSNVCSYGNTACQLCAREEKTVTNAAGDTVTVKACQLYDAVPPSCRDGKIQSQYCYSATTGTICSEGDTDCVIIGGHEGAGLPCEYFDFITDGQPASSEDCDCIGEGYYLYNEDGSYSCNNFYNDKVCPDYYTGTGSDHCFFCNLSCKKERIDKPTCGDGTIQRSNCSGYDNCQTVAGADEECDDKNKVNTDSCTNECKLAKCGDGYIQAELGEKCDSGDKNGYYAVDCDGTAACPGCAGWNCGMPDEQGNQTDKLGPHCGDGKVQNPALCTADDTTLDVNGYASQDDFFAQNGFRAHDGLTAVEDCQQKLAHAAEVCDDGENNGTAITFSDFLNDNSWNMENCAFTVDGELQPVNELHANYAECVYKYKEFINTHKRCASDCSAFTSPYCGDGDQQADFSGNSEKCDEGLPPITVVDGHYYVGEKDNYNGKGYFHCKLDCSKKYDCGDDITETSDCPLTDGVCKTVGEIKDGSTVLYVKGPYPDSAVGEGCDAGTMNGTYGSCDELCKTVAKCGNGNKKTPTEQGDCIEKVPGSSTCLRRENCDFGTDNPQKHNKTSVDEAWSAEQYGSCIAEVGCDTGVDQWGDRICCEWGRYCGDGTVDNGNGVGSVTGVDGETTTQGWRLPVQWTLKNADGEISETASVNEASKELAIEIVLGSDGYAFAELGIDLPVKNERWFIEYDIMVSKQGDEAVSVSGGVNQYEDGGTTPLTGDYNNASPYYVVEKDAVDYVSGIWKHKRSGVIHGFASGATNAWFTGTDFVRIVFKLTGAENTSFYIKALKFYSIESGSVQAGGGSANEMCDPGKDNFKTESSYYMTDCQAGCKWINYCGDSIIQRSDCTGFEGCTVVSGGEEVCDNGTNSANVYGGCEPGCVNFGPRCGDAVVDRTSCASYEGGSICNVPDGMLAKDNEACDLGNNNADTPLSWQVVDANDYTKGRPVENTACRTNCNVPRCGDGVLDTVTIFDVNKNAYVQVEECDCGAPGSYNSATAGQIATDSKGNTYEDICIIKDSAGNITEFYNTFSAVKSPACRPNCKVSRCGDGIKDEGEACDDGNFDNNDTCKNDCTFATCDDGVFAYNRSYLCEELEGKNGIGLKAMADRGVIDCEDQASCTALLNGEETATLNLIESWFEAGYLHCCYNPKINGGTDDHNCEIPDGSGFKAPKKVAVDNCVAYSKKHTGGDSYSARTEAQCDEDVDPLFEKPFSDMFERCEQCVDADCGCAELFTEGSAKYIECIDNNRYCGGTCWNRIGKCGDGRIDNGSGLTIDAGEKCDNLTEDTAGSYSELDGNSITVSDKKGIGRYCTGKCRGTCTSTSYMCGDIDPSTNAAVTDNCWTVGCTVSNHGGDNSAATSRCGDGIVDIYAGEECDEKEGGDYTTNWCGPNCRWNTTPGEGQSRCGDKVVQGTSGEKCDDGTLDSDDDEIDNDYCVKDCTVYYGYCGDGNITGAGYSLDTLYTYECTLTDGCAHGPEDCDLKKNNDNTYSGDARSVSLAETGLLVDTKICNECEKPGYCGNGERNPRFEGCDCWTASNASEESCDETLQSGEISVETKCSKTCTAEPVGQVEKWLPSKISGWACDPDHPMTHQAVTKDDGGTETGGMVRVEFFNSLNTAMTDPDYTKLVTTDEDVTAEIKNNVTVICGGGSAHGWEMSPSTLGLDKAKGPYKIRVYAIALDTGEEDKLIGMKEGFITAMSCGDGVVSRCSDIEVTMADGSSRTWWNDGTCLDADVEGNCSDYGLTPGEPCVDEACDRIAGVAFGSDGDCYDSGDNKCQWTSCGDGIWQAVSTRAEECDGTDPNNGTVSCNGKAAEGSNPAIPAPVVVDEAGGTISGEVKCNNSACKWNRSFCTILSQCPALVTAITDETGHVVWNDFNYKTEKIGQYVKYTGNVSEYTRTWDSVANDWPDSEKAVKPNVAGVTAQCKFDCAENLKWDNEGAGENSKCVPKTDLVHECGSCPEEKANGHGVWWSSAAEDKNCQTNNPVKTIAKTVSINDDGDVVISPASAVIEFNKDADDSTKCVWKCDNDSVYRQADGKCYPKADPYHCKTLSTGVPEGMPTNATTFPEGSAYAWIKVTKDASNHIVLGARSASLDIPRTLDETFGDTGGDFYTPKVAKLGALSLNDATNHLVDIDTETESLCFWTCSEGYHWSNNYNKCIANSAETLCGNGQIDSEHCDTVTDAGTCIFTVGADEKCDSGNDNGKYNSSGSSSNCDKYCGSYKKCKTDNPDNFATKCAFINATGYSGRIASTSSKPEGEYYCGDGYVQVPSYNDSYFTKCNDAGLTCKLVTEGNYPGSLLEANEKCDNSANKIALCNLALGRTSAPVPTNTTTGGYYDLDNVSCKSDCSTILRPGDACGYCGDGAFQTSESCEFVNGGVSFGTRTDGTDIDGKTLCESGKMEDLVQNASSNAGFGTSTIYSGSIEEWIVPQTGIYEIEVHGAKGGNGYYIKCTKSSWGSCQETQISATYQGCSGAKVTARYKLTAGQKLRLLAGKRGGFRNSHSSTRYIAGGGGGGSFVVLCNNSTCSTPTPLVIAGGGGGAYPDNISAICRQGQAGNNGTSWTGGGETIISGGSSGSDGGNGTRSHGGLGWTDHKQAFTGETPSTTEFYGTTVGNDDPHGGFGGGGYGYYYYDDWYGYYYAHAGGGGGYSGGSAGFDNDDYDYYAGGGGGGSYYDTNTTRFISGSNSWTEGGAETTDGLIKISMVKYPGCNASSCTIDSSNFVDCGGRLAKCIYPDNAELWNPSEDTITQTFNSSTNQWEPNNVNVYSTTGTEKCAFKCKTGNYNDGICGDKRTIECTGKPEHSHWNIADQITQTWNIGQNKWLPDETAVYGETSTTECHYACDTGYTYDSVNKTCINERTVNCTWPSSIVTTGASWNTVSSITQHWDLNHCVSENDCWYPRAEGVYNAEASTTECRIACDFNYNWDDNSTCVPATQTVPCDGLPENAEWLEGYSTILQTWNGSDFGPANTGNWKGSGAANCIYQCTANYHRKGSTNACESNTRTANCGSVPNGAYPNTASSITQTWTVTDGDRWSNVGDKWTPSLSPVYSADPSADVCHFKCGSGYSTINEDSGCEYCGDNNTNGPEGCDNGSNNSNAWAASASARNCKTDCSGWAPYCGDGKTDSGNETCDSGSANSNSWAVAKHCKANCSGWAPYCGDGNIDTDNEQCDSAYAAKCLDDYKYWESTIGRNYGNDGNSSVYIYSGTIQKYELPETGIYEITAHGAAGGDGYKGTGTNDRVQEGCAGAKATAQFKLEKGWMLKILAGKPGGKHPYSSRYVGGGGGGGSFVVLCTDGNTCANPIPLVIAGGGGGGSGFSASNSCTQGQAGRDGSKCSSSSCFAGGTNGNDGTSSSNSKGGKGWNNHKTAFNTKPTELEGFNASDNDDVDGGYGGGGYGYFYRTSNSYAGGGGGYSGGGSSYHQYGGGGGGSYIIENSTDPGYSYFYSKPDNALVTGGAEYTTGENANRQGKVIIKFLSYKTCSDTCQWGSSYKTCGTKTAQCEGLPENAHWTTDTTVDQTWSNNAWSPTNLGCLDGDSGCNNACKFACDDGYVYENGQCVVDISCPDGQHYEGGSCVSNTRTGKACDSKPSNPAPTTWWGTGLIDQTWTQGTGWAPATTAFCSNTSTGVTDCSYKCDGSFHCKEDQSGCEYNTRPQNCDAKPANSVWNDGHTGENVGRYEQTWTLGSGWSTVATEYNSETEGDCHWKCASNYHESNGACVANMAICSPTNTTYPCLDSDTSLIWSALSSSNEQWQASDNRCSGLQVGGINSGWRLPTIDELRTLVRNCPKSEIGGDCPISNPTHLAQTDWNATDCSSCENSVHTDDGYYSKLGDKDIYLWSSSKMGTDYAWSIRFRYAGIYIQGLYDNTKIYSRCVHAAN